jgi:hypothetical protein
MHLPDMTPYFQFPQSPENMITLTKITAADNRATHDMDGVADYVSWGRAGRLLLPPALIALAIANSR